MPSQDGGTECTFKFGSWTYSEDSIDLQLRMEEMNLSEYKEHVVHNLVNATAERNELFYSCCPESYPDVTYKINLQPVQPKCRGCTPCGTECTTNTFVYNTDRTKPV
jgi:MinD superfamily P-loop ATPase